MASPSTVITLGFGSFGSVSLLPTLGFGVASVPYSAPLLTISRQDIATLTIERGVGTADIGRDTRTLSLTRINVQTLDVARVNVGTLEVRQ